MPELRKVSGHQVIKALVKLGFERARQRGSHVVLRKHQPGGDAGCVVPLHRELKIGTLKGILHQAKISTEEFLKALHD